MVGRVWDAGQSLFIPISFVVGYANEVGESFRAIVPVSLVWASYGVATAYVTADAVDKGKKAAAVSNWAHLFCL